MAASKEPVDLADYSNLIDAATFDQILEMDEDDDDQDFSKSIVLDFFQQAHATFDEMDVALEEKDLEVLSARGHFLKGSSATLGFTKVKDNCEKIQNIGARKDATGSNPSTEDDDALLAKLKDIIAVTKVELDNVEDIMKRYFHQDM